MRTLLVVSLLFSLSALAQTRVRENIKQQSIVTQDGVQVIKKATPAPAPAPVKQVKK